MEFDNGLLAGLEYSVARERYPSVPVPLHDSVYEQESALRFRYRAEVVLSKLLSEHGENATIAVVSPRRNDQPALSGVSEASG